MSWGATAFTPIVTHNVPPFGFHEAINPPDFKVCNENPWGTGERMKREIQDALKFEEYRRRLNISDKRDIELGYDLDYDHAQQLRCAGGCAQYVNGNAKGSVMEKFISGSVFGYSFTESFAMAVILVLFVWWIYRNHMRLSIE